MFVFSFIYKNKLWKVIYRKQNINKLSDISEKQLHKVGPDFCLSMIKSKKKFLWNLYASDDAFLLEGIERNRFPYQNACRM